MRFIRKIAILAMTTIAITGIQAAQARPNAKANELASYSVIHAIPLSFGADVVDVYANNVLVVDNATPGSIKSLTLPRGNLTVSFYANGVVPSPTTTPLLISSPTYLSSGANFSYVAHLTSDEKPKLSQFKNMVTEAGSKRSWLTIRHVAAAPALQFRTNGNPVFIPLTNSIERKRTLTFGNYSVDALYDDSSTVAINPYSLSLQKGSNAVLYVWGAKSKGNLAVLKQDIAARK